LSTCHLSRKSQPEIFLTKIWQKKNAVDIQNVSTAIVDEIAEVQQETTGFLKFHIHEGPYPVVNPNFFIEGATQKFY